MQCPSCQNQNLSPSGDGKLVCDDCGEQFEGFQEEEVDFVLAGTAVSTRQSQSSQAQKRRVQVRRISEQPVAHPRKSNTLDELLICEGAFLLAKAIANKLIELSYVDSHIMVPLFEILTCWVRGRHAYAGFSSLNRSFQSYYILSFISLAALYIRSAMLPRDLCRLVNTKQIPFLAALKTVFPLDFEKREAVRTAFTPERLPVARHVVRFALEFVRGKETWLPLRKFFLTNRNDQVPFHFSFEAEEAVPLSGGRNVASFPIGHLHITLLRLIRLVGLPDVFGERVLRYIELRRVAVKMARNLAGDKDGPWHASSVDAYPVDHIPHHLNPQRPFSQPVPGHGDLYGFPTDESLQIDIINTMRLCYGQGNKGRILSQDNDTELDAKLADEWETCKESMMTWLRYGNAEDIDNITWTSLSPNVIASMRGEALRAYTQLTDDILTERGEQPPELWEKFIRAFEKIAKKDPAYQNGKVGDDHVEDHIRTESRCMYALKRFGDEPSFEVTEGKEAMDQEVVPYRCDETYCGLDKSFEREPLRDFGDRLREGEHPTSVLHKRRKRATTVEDFLLEPAGIGLAWTILDRFFEGTNVVVADTEVTATDRSNIYRMKVTSDRTLAVTVRYILGLKRMRADKTPKA